MHSSMLPRFGNCIAICSAFNFLIFLLACIRSLIEVLISQAPKLMLGHVWLDFQFNCPARPLSWRTSPVVNWASLDIFPFVSLPTSFNSSMYNFWSSTYNHFLNYSLRYLKLSSSSGLVIKLSYSL